MSEWKGIVYHSSLEDGKDSCSIKINGLNAVGSTTKNSHSIDLREAKISIGGTSNNMIYIRDTHNEMSFSTRDKSILKALEESGIPGIIDGLGNYKKSLWAWNSWLVTSLLIILFAILGSTIGFHFYGVNLAVKGISYDVDKKIGEAYIKSMSFSYNEETSFVRDSMQKIVDHLTGHLPSNHFKYEVNIMISNQVNAFALPGGKIVVLSGLIKESQSWEEVAGVLAHEIMHVEKRHGVKGLVQSLGNSLIFWSIFGEVDGAVGLMLDNVESLTSFKFSRDMERESDKEGFLLLQKSGISPQGMITFFQILEKQENPERDIWKSTHPLTSERVSTLQAMLANMDTFTPKPLTIDWEKIKTIVSSAE